ncbi:unnamed protein product [Rotaria sp. Silwood1]|nr:unnamed protein product [Rotaria sp. Silwood1]
MCLSENECTSRIFNTSEIIFTCLSDIVINELPLYNYTTDKLANITSIIVNGVDDNTRGPFTSIPPNICLLPNLKNIDFSYNRIGQVDPANVLSDCLSSVTTFDVSDNNISEFPSAMIYNMPTLQKLYFRFNQLTYVPGNVFFNLSNLDIIDFSHNSLTNFELWALLVNKSADFSNNQISTITNTAFYNISEYTLSDATINLTNNSATINLTDAVYEMYGSCSEVYYWLNSSTPDPLITKPILSSALSYIDFGTTRINCSCDQSYIVAMISTIFADSNPAATSRIPIYSAKCLDGTLFIDNTCTFDIDLPNSSVDFSKVYPRQCKIYEYESGNLTTISNISVPTINVSTYPHYETKMMEPGACFFNFSNMTTVRIKCTKDISDSSTIPSELLSSDYFSNIRRVDFARSISSLPSYICSLPSHDIDLSFQSFTILNDETFPCLDWFRSVSLANNQMTSVNMRSGNFTNLTLLDLSSNQLTGIPYSILIPTPSSLRFLDLRNNSITSIDLFLYTLKNITIDLRDNPINISSIINPLNVTLLLANNTNSTTIITFPSSVTNSTYIFNDQTALTAGTCNRYAILAYRNTLQSVYNNILLDCTCASINLKEIFLRNQSDITQDFTCSNGTSTVSFNALTILSCGSATLNFSSGLCLNESLQTFLDNTTMESLSTHVQLTSTSLTILIINSSSSSSPNVTKNQQYISLPEFEGKGIDFYTLQITNNSKQLSTLYIETITSKNSSYSKFTSISSSSDSHSMTISSAINPIAISIDTTTTLPTIPSLSSILLTTNATETVTDNNMMISTDWTTTTTTTTTSTSTSTTTSTSSTTTTSTSTTTTTSTSSTTTTSTSTTTTSVTTTSTSTSTSTSTTTTTTTTSVTTTSTSTSTSTSTTTTTTTTSVTTTSTSTSTSTSTTTTTTTTTTTKTIAAIDSSTNRTGLIVGLVLGLVGFFALVGGFIAAIVVLKARAASNATVTNKPVVRTMAMSQAPPDSLLESRLQTRNLRPVRLTPLTTQTSQLPRPSFGSVVSETTTTHASMTKLHRSDPQRSSRGIPLRLDAIRSASSIVPQYAPSSYTSNKPSNYDPINNLSKTQRPYLHQQYGHPTIYSVDTTNWPQLILTCPNSTRLDELPFLSISISWLRQFTSFLAQGENNTREPFISIPSDICWMSHLTILNLTYNQLENTLNFSDILNCSTRWKTIHLSNNYLATFPSSFFTSTQFNSVYLNDNKLSSFDLSILTLGQRTVDLRRNQIKSITNPTNYSISLDLQAGDTEVQLDGNSILDFNDGIYEMYRSCEKVRLALTDTLNRPTSLTFALINIDLGSTTTSSSKTTTATSSTTTTSETTTATLSSMSTTATSTTTATSESTTSSSSSTSLTGTSSTSITLKTTTPTTITSTSMMNISTCLSTFSVSNTNLLLSCSSNANMSLLPINNYTLTTLNRVTSLSVRAYNGARGPLETIPPNVCFLPNLQIYRYYLTQTVNNSYCLFTFYVGGRRVSIDCINESSTLTEISSVILNNIYFQNITQVSINNQNSLSQLPVYLCSLPSNSIDLSNQSFWILNSHTFPCSSNNTVQNINLAYNQINTVTLTLSNWILIDLTSNNLPQLPYTILRSNQNAISKNNPFSKTINGYHIINNYEKKSLLNGPVSTNIIRSNQMRFLLNDQIALCQFARLANSSPSNDLNAKDNGRVLAIVLGSLGFLLLLALIIAGICYALRDTADTRLEERVQTRNIRQPYNLSSIDNRTTSQLANIHDTRDYSRMQTSHRPATRNRSSYYVASIDLCQVGDNRRKRRPKEPPIDYDIT